MGIFVGAFGYPMTIAADERSWRFVEYCCVFSSSFSMTRWSYLSLLRSCALRMIPLETTLARPVQLDSPPMMLKRVFVGYMYSDPSRDDEVLECITLKNEPKGVQLASVWVQQQ